jgi:hypothetical protein
VSAIVDGKRGAANVAIHMWSSRLVEVGSALTLAGRGAQPI